MQLQNVYREMSELPLQRRRFFVQTFIHDSYSKSVFVFSCRLLKIDLSRWSTSQNCERVNEKISSVYFIITHLRRLVVTFQPRTDSRDVQGLLSGVVRCLSLWLGPDRVLCECVRVKLCQKECLET